MDLPPSSQKVAASFCNEADRLTDFRALHSLDPDQLRPITRADEIDLRVTVAEDMHMSRFVVVEIDDDPQAVCSEYRDHENG
jgi:hypothetical protein